MVPFSSFFMALFPHFSAFHLSVLGLLFLSFLPHFHLFSFPPCPHFLALCPTQTPPDDGIYWQVNLERFHQHFRDQALVSAVASRMDQVCGSYLHSHSGTELLPS